MLEKSKKEARAIAKKIAAELKGLREVTFDLTTSTILSSTGEIDATITVTLWFGQSFSKDVSGICSDARDVKILAGMCRRAAEERLAKILELVERSREGKV